MIDKKRAAVENHIANPATHCNRCQYANDDRCNPAFGMFRFAGDATCPACGRVWPKIEFDDADHRS